MATLTLKANNEKEMRIFENVLREAGYKKTDDCMWAKIYTKGNSEYIVTKEW